MQAWRAKSDRPTLLLIVNRYEGEPRNRFPEHALSDEFKAVIEDVNSHGRWAPLLAAGEVPPGRFDAAVVLRGGDRPSAPDEHILPLDIPACLVMLRRRRSRNSDDAESEIPTFVLSSPTFHRSFYRWLDEVFPHEGYVAPTSDRAAIEALYQQVQLGIVENEQLRGYVDQLSRELESTQNDLSDSQVEVRTLQALLDQVEAQNASLLKELSKVRVDPVSTSLAVKAIRYLTPFVLTGAIGFGTTYAGTIAGQPDAAQMHRTERAILDHCEAVIEAIGPVGE